MMLQGVKRLFDAVLTTSDTGVRHVDLKNPIISIFFYYSLLYIFSLPSLLPLLPLSPLSFFFDLLSRS
jgi:hypothetical protein